MQMREFDVSARETIASHFLPHFSRELRRDKVEV
jgi:hypothetical protein